jgi:nitrite reductase/ring-hydroxylating ferredoxin subunit
VTIDRSGPLWRGNEATDIDAYLGELQPGGYPPARIVHALCARDGGSIFAVRVDGEEGYAERLCPACNEAVAMLDSGEFAEDANPEPVICPCGGDQFEVAVGFALRENGDILWVSLGLRCTRDGVLGSPADWHIDYGPTDHLFAQV